MAVNSRNPNDVRIYSLDQIFNQSFDRETQTLLFQNLGFDGQNLQRGNADNLAVKISSGGTATYVGLAAPGTTAATAKWQCFKYDTGLLTWADGDSNFDNIATDLTSLNYV